MNTIRDRNENNSHMKKADLIMPLPEEIVYRCVAEGTHIKVIMDGNSVEKEVQEIIAGDIVDLGSGKTATVKEKWRGPSDNCVIVKAMGRTLKMSKDHPVMTAEGWKRAEKLKITDKIMDVSEAFAKIDSIESAAKETQTYNLEYVFGENPRIEAEEYMIAEGFVVGNMRTQNSNNL